MDQAIGHRDIEERVLEVSHSASTFAFPMELRDLTKQLLAERYAREDLLKTYKNTVVALREEGLEDQEDELIEVMRELEGRCGPYAAL